VEEVLEIGAACPASGQMPLRAGKQVADRQQIFVVGSACRAYREMPTHRGALILVKVADEIHPEIVAPSGAALTHPLSP
jgi:hypothetical protein